MKTEGVFSILKSRSFLSKKRLREVHQFGEVNFVTHKVHCIFPDEHRKGAGAAKFIIPIGGTGSTFFEWQRRCESGE
jgi:hypothetical protein